MTLPYFERNAIRQTAMDEQQRRMLPTRQLALPWQDSLSAAQG
jgi:hypothetical protein